MTHTKMTSAKNKQNSRIKYFSFFGHEKKSEVFFGFLN